MAAAPALTNLDLGYAPGVVDAHLLALARQVSSLLPLPSPTPTALLSLNGVVRLPQFFTCLIYFR